MRISKAGERETQERDQTIVNTESEDVYSVNRNVNLYRICTSYLHEDRWINQCDNSEYPSEECEDTEAIRKSSKVVIKI